MKIKMKMKMSPKERSASGGKMPARLWRENKANRLVY